MTSQPSAKAKLVKINCEILIRGVLFSASKMQQLTRESGSPQPPTTWPVCAPPLARSWIRSCVLSCAVLVMVVWFNDSDYNDVQS